LKFHPIKLTLAGVVLSCVNSNSRSQAPAQDGNTSHPQLADSGTRGDAQYTDGRIKPHEHLQVENLDEVFQTVLTKIQGAVPSGDWQITADNPARKDRLAWLTRDFGARIFLSAIRVDEALLQMSTREGPLHLGVLSLRFQNCKSLREARSAVSKVGRLNFALPVLTIFRTKAHDHSLTFIMSETPLIGPIDGLLKNLDRIVGPDIKCAE
jgi:hypothetical protein